jgi:hypothetical protein
MLEHISRGRNLHWVCASAPRLGTVRGSHLEVGPMWVSDYI